MYTCTVSTRGYELASDGVIPPAMFSRYLEHVRWNVLLDGPAAIRAITSRRRAVIRAQRMELSESIAHGVTLTFTTWIARVGRSSVDFGHRILLPDRRTLGLASATLVVLDAAGKPTPLPDEVREAVVDDAGPKLLPLSDAAPANAWCQPVVVRPSDLDLLQHVNQANYVAFFDDARRQAAAVSGYGELSVQAQGHVRYVSIDHRQEVRLGDAVEVATWLPETQDLQGGLSLAFELRQASGKLLLCRGRMDLST